MSSQDEDRPDHSGEIVRGARHRRQRLRASMDALEAAIAAAAPGREGDWRQRVGMVLADMAPVLDEHIAETEAPDGLLERVLADAPRLAHAVEVLRDDHARLREMLAAARAPLGGDAGAEEVRSAAVDLLGLLVRHRHRGADVLYEAYSVDVGTGD